MKIRLICVGKIKESFFRQAIDEYSKRLQRYIQLDIVEVSDEKAPDTLSKNEEIAIKQKEGEKILKCIKQDEYLVCLDILGTQMTSEDFSSFFDNKASCGISKINFVIGGSLGLSKEVLQRADFSVSFSKMTFPHQLMRVVLLEQIYRAMRIAKNEPYHK